MSVPDEQTCQKLLDRYGVPEHIIAHSELVAALALALGRALNRNGDHFDLDLVRAGGLLHDVAKMDSLQNGLMHSEQGRDLMLGLGYPEVADIISTHVVIDVDAPLTEAHLINYADKRVMHSQVVGLVERFEDIAERYGKGYPDRLLKMKENLDRSLRLEKRLFEHLPFGPDQLEAQIES